MKKLFILSAALVLALGLAATAYAHVEVHPNGLPASTSTSIVIRVPNERPKSATVSVDVQFPPGFIFVEYQPMPGWRVKVYNHVLPKPVTINGTTYTQDTDRIVFYAGHLVWGQFIEFPLKVGIPDVSPGTVLTFKALQTYANGEIVRWIGAPGTDHPAPRVKILSPDAQVVDFPQGVDVVRASTFQGPTLGIVLGVPALALAGFLLVRSRRKHTI